MRNSDRLSALSPGESHFIIGSVKINPRLLVSQIAKNVAERFRKNALLIKIQKELKKDSYPGRVLWKKPFISRVNDLFQRTPK